MSRSTNQLEDPPTYLWELFLLRPLVFFVFSIHRDTVSSVSSRLCAPSAYPMTSLADCARPWSCCELQPSIRNYQVAIRKSRCRQLEGA